MRSLFDMVEAALRCFVQPVKELSKTVLLRSGSRPISWVKILISSPPPPFISLNSKVNSVIDYVFS